MNNDANASTVGHLLTKAYCFEYEGVNELMENFSSLGNIQKNEIVKIAWQFINNNSSLNRAIKLITEFLDIDDKDLANTYSLAFYHLEVSIFIEIFDFLKLYIF